MMIDDAATLALWQVYHDLHLQAIKGGMDEQKNPLWAIWHKLEATLVSLGVLEDEEEAEDAEEEEREEDPAGEYADFLYDQWKDRQLMAELGGYKA